VQVRLADDDRSGVDEALHRRRGPLGYVVGVDLRAVRRAHARRVDQVLDEEPLAVQRARERLTRPDLRDNGGPPDGPGNPASATTSSPPTSSPSPSTGTKPERNNSSPARTASV